MYRSSYRPEDAAVIIRHGNEMEETTAELRRRHVHCVLPGCEMGVELADQLSEQLGLPSNGTRLSQARRDKSSMAEAVRKHGLCTPATFSSQQIGQLTDWVRQQNRWPVVLKPLYSSGSDGVCLCVSESEIRPAFADIMNRRDVFGSRNTAVLAQEYVAGTQFAVDTVSYSGRHKVAAFWQYGKPALGSSFFGDDSLELLPPCESLHDQLFPYVSGVLDALEIKYGPAHCEVMWSDGAPVLIEIGARLNGGGNPELSRLCGGMTQVEMTVEAYLEPARFLATLDEPNELLRRAIRVFLTPEKKGKLTGFSGLPEIERLPSFHEMRISAKCGLPAPKIAGWVVLVHPDRIVIQEDPPAD